MNKILIIRFSSIGDIVLTSPVIRCLKNQIPDAEIHFATKKAYGPLLSANPYIDKIHLLDNDFVVLKKALKIESYDFVADLHHNLRSLRLKKYLRKPSKSFEKLNLQKWLKVNFNAGKLPDEHIVDRYMQTVESLNVKNDGGGLDFFIDEKSRVGAEAFPDHLRNKLVNNAFVALVIGAGHATKKLPIARLTRLAGMIGHPIMLMGGPQDVPAGERIASAFPEKVWNACGLFDLQQSADLIGQARCVVTPDTGLMHIAAALDKPILSLWGNTIPAFGMTPYFGTNSHNAARSVIMEVEGLPCRPCSKIGYERCPKGHFKCMQRIDLHKIVLWVDQLCS